MSRSYRKPYVTDGYKGSKRKQFCKKYANNVVSKTEDVPDGKAYRKFSNTYDICDYRWHESPSGIKKHWPKWWKLLRK